MISGLRTSSPRARAARCGHRPDALTLNNGTHTPLSTGAASAPRPGNPLAKQADVGVEPEGHWAAAVCSCRSMCGPMPGNRGNACTSRIPQPKRDPAATSPDATSRCNGCRTIAWKRRREKGSHRRARPPAPTRGDRARCIGNKVPQGSAKRSGARSWR